VPNLSPELAEQSASEPGLSWPRKQRKRLIEYSIVVGLILILMGAAYFQEDISSYARLRMWDSGAPGRVVLQFLEAGKKGEKATTDKLLAAGGYQTVNQNGKWAGYSVTAMPGTMQFLFADLSPNSGKVLKTEFTRLGNGSATVTVPDAKGKPTKYRLEMTDNGWKITDILGGRPLPPGSR